MVVRKRGEHGKFAAKSDQHRHVRSLRLTNKAWETLGAVAETHSMTRSDLIEQLVERNQVSTGQSSLSLQRVEDAIAKILADPQVTRNGRDKGSIKRALEALLSQLD